MFEMNFLSRSEVTQSRWLHYGSHIVLFKMWTFSWGGLMHQACPPVCQATLKRGRLHRAAKVDPLLFLGYSDGSHCNIHVVWSGYIYCRLLGRKQAAFLRTTMLLTVVGTVQGGTSRVCLLWWTDMSPVWTALSLVLYAYPLWIRKTPQADSCLDWRKKEIISRRRLHLFRSSSRPQ